MENQDQDDFVENHIKQVRMCRKSGRHVNHVHFQYHLDDIAKENVGKRKKKGYARKKCDKRKRKKSHRGYFKKPKTPNKKNKKSKKSKKFGPQVDDVEIWEQSYEAKAPTTLEKQEIEADLKVFLKNFFCDFSQFRGFGFCGFLCVVFLSKGHNYWWQT